jgi:hypothetical protein
MRPSDLNAEGVFPYVSLLRRGKRLGNERPPSRDCFPETRETRETKGQFTLVILAEPAGKDLFGQDPTYRLKRLLKRLLRNYGFRCLEVKP